VSAILESLRKNPKVVLTGLVPIILLAALVLATGGSGLFASGGSGSRPASTNSTVSTSSTSSSTFGGVVQGQISAKANHVRGRLWRFTYTVHDTGMTPIAGFQINGPVANVFDVNGLAGWDIFGAGVCHGRFPSMLVYWSTGSSSPRVIKPGATVVFSFDVNTTGQTDRLYSLSWGQARAQFGQITGPAPSGLPATGACKA